MNQQFLTLIKKRRNGEITRQQLCHAWAQLQGFDDTVKGYVNRHGIFITYRGRIAQINNGVINWTEKDGRKCYSISIKAMKIAIDTEEITRYQKVQL